MQEQKMPLWLPTVWNSVLTKQFRCGCSVFYINNMKILHTSDWHLGHRLHEQSQHYEQEKFLEWLIQVINEKSIDVLIVSGDIYDTGYPSTQSQDLFFRFLADMYSNTNCKEVVITAGNHDAPGTLNAPDNFVRHFNINLIGKATEDLSEEILTFEINGEQLIVAAVPFLRDRDIRRAITGEDAGDIENRYKKALTNHYRKIAKFIERQQPEGAFVVSMGHLFAIGGQTSESENRIYVGGLGDIAAEDFPDIFRYVALGHLHRAQTVGGKEHIRYSGSPYALSFSEAGNAKNVVIITTEKGTTKSIEEAAVPVFRKLYRITGSMEDCRIRLEEIAHNNDKAEPWVEVNLNEKGLAANAYTLINDFIKDKPLKVLRVKNVNTQTLADITRIEDEDRQLNELKPDDVFKRKCKEDEYDIYEHKEILDAFYEILNTIETSKIGFKHTRE